jgi:hypothetical protein
MLNGLKKKGKGQRAKGKEKYLARNICHLLIGNYSPEIPET